MCVCVVGPVHPRDSEDLDALRIRVMPRGQPLQEIISVADLYRLACKADGLDRVDPPLLASATLAESDELMVGSHYSSEARGPRRLCS